MPCNIHPSRSGPGHIIACSRGSSARKWCSVCHKPSDLLCDFPLEDQYGGLTCSKSLCGTCAKPGSRPGEDYCPSHVSARMAR